MLEIITVRLAGILTRNLAILRRQYDVYTKQDKSLYSTPVER